MKRASLFLSVALWLFATRAAAEPSEMDTFALNWVREPGAEGCVSSPALSRMLEQVTGPVLRTAAHAKLLVEGSVGRDAARGFYVRIRVLDRGGTAIGERELSAREPQCSALTQSVLLVIAMIVSPESVQRGLPSEVLDQLMQARREEARTAHSALPASRPRVETETTSRALVAAPAAAAGERLTASPQAPVQALAALLLGRGFVPGWTPGLRLGARIATLRGWTLLVAADLWAPANVAVDTLRALDGGVDFGAAHLASALCADILSAGSFAWNACGGGVLGSRWTSAHALAEQNQRLSPYFAASLGTDAAFKLASRWAVRGGATALLSLGRERFTYRDYRGDEQLLFETPRAAAFFHLELGASL